MPKGTLWTIMSDMSFIDLENFCRTESSIAKQCNNINFWSWLIDQKGISFGGRKTIATLKYSYREWSRVNMFLFIETQPLTGHGSNPTMIHDALKVAQNNCAVTIADDQTFHTPDPTVTLIPVAQRTWRTVSFPAIEYNIISTRGILLTNPIGNPTVTPEIFAGVTYWIIFMGAPVSSTIRIYMSEDEAFEMLEADLEYALVNAIETVEPNETPEHKAPLQAFIKQIDGPIPTDNDFENYIEYAEVLTEFLMSYDMRYLWKQGFTIYGSSFQIACFNLK